MPTSLRLGCLPAIVLVPLLAAERSAIAGDGSCPPTAVVTGDLTLSEAVRTSLEKRGIALEKAASCPAVAVDVKRTARGLRVSLVDEDGRHSERELTDADTAAAWIESWARPDLSIPAYVRPRERPFVAARDAEEPAALRPIIIYAPQPRPVDATATTTISIATDGSLWVGVDAGACIRIGRVCAGAVVGTRFDTEAVGGSERYETSRFAVDLRLTADLPVQWGRTRLRPGIGAGVGWLRSHAKPDVTSPGTQVDIDGGGLRLDAHVAASIPLGRSLSLEVDLGLDASLHAHTAVYRDEGLTLAGEPRGFARAGIGLRYGAR